MYTIPNYKNMLLKVPSTSSDENLSEEERKKREKKAKKEKKKRDKNAPPTLREMFRASAKSLKRAFPTYEELTVGDITIGLASVAVEHKRHHKAQHSKDEPILFTPQEGDYDFATFKPGEKTTVNPDGIDAHKFVLADRLLPYSNWVYYPIVLIEKDHFVIMESTDNSLAIAETLTKNKEHRKLRAQPIDNVLKYSSESHHMQQVYFAKIDNALDALVISVRGTDSNMDIFTNFTCDPVPLSAHKHYSHTGGDEKITGVVHGGKLGSALWVLSQIENQLHDIFLTQNPDYINVCRIFTVGHSLGGAIATLLAILLREFFLKNKDLLGTEPLPEVRAFTYSPSAFISYDMSRWCRSFVDSFIKGMDLVPRFSVGQVEYLRTEIVSTNYQTKVDQYLNKHKKTAQLVESINHKLEKKGHNPLFKIHVEAPKVYDEEQTEEEKAAITTLYPAGNMHWFVTEKSLKLEKDFPRLLFEYIEQKLADEADEFAEKVPSAKKLAKIWWKESKEKKKQRKKNVTMPKTKKSCTVRLVDAKHFDRIILTRNVFSDHRLLNFPDMFENVLQSLGKKPQTDDSTGYSDYSPRSDSVSEDIFGV
jgi:hypothetical protein